MRHLPLAGEAGECKATVSYGCPETRGHSPSANTSVDMLHCCSLYYLRCTLSKLPYKSETSPRKGSEHALQGSGGERARGFGIDAERSRVALPLVDAAFLPTSISLHT